ncbi:MAG TPA: ornithine carbamoyltransferase [Acidimicrobiales bacterium]|nr:ornithine carbamoyltransferase [Acidimicrobiales bacterium]
MTPRHFLEVTDLTAEELTAVLDLAEAPSLPPVLHQKGVALIFEKPSNRTRQSMEIAVVQLGGHPVYTRGDEVGFDGREPVEDVARIMAGYHAVLAARVFEHEVLLRMAAVSSVPVVNLLSERSHPMQALADVLTMRQAFGSLARRTVAWVGDYNNVARSLGEAAALLGMHIRYGSPIGYGPDEAELERLQLLGAATVVAFPLLTEAVVGADAVHTDVWTSMGQESETAARTKAFEGWIVTEEVMAAAGPHSLFFHCMPAHRGEEVTAAVMDGPRSRAVQQGHNRLHAARGLLAFLMGVRP